MGILSQIKLKHLFSNTYLRVLPSGKSCISKACRIRNCHIIVGEACELIIEEGVELDNVNITLTDGKLYIGKNSIVKSSLHKVEIIVSRGAVRISDHVRLSCRRIWCRFGGELNVGAYTNINDWSELRCDEHIDIGSFNQISYNVRIWDTNTHRVLPVADRRRLTVDRFPSFGYEEHRPVTKPVVIGDDCWIGEYAAILKGVTIGNEVIVGFGTFLTNATIPDSSVVMNHKPVIVKHRD